MRGPVRAPRALPLPPRQARRQRTGTRVMRVLALVLVVLASMTVLRSPVQLLAVLTPSGAPERGAATGSTEPDRAVAPSVLSDVTDIDDRALLDGAAPADDVTQGRWGTTPARPSTPGILIEEVRGGWRVESGNEEAAAIAVIAAHVWADALRRPSGATPGTDGTGGARAIVAIEAVERPGAHHAVVTALVAPDGPEGALRRIAIPVLFGQNGPALAGTPWPLPAPTASSPVDSHRGLVGTPVGDEELIASARRALEAVGLPGDRLVALEATDGWPFIARLDDDAESHPWLRWHLDRFVVTGLPLEHVGSMHQSENDR